MSETPEQYTRRILGYMEGKEPLARWQRPLRSSTG